MTYSDYYEKCYNMAPYDKERFDLQRELARVTRERDILKKALASQKE
ncbi:hypothetical protein [Wolbachia endosymbiont (group A) of Aleiodes leptofemur]